MESRNLVTISWLTVGVGLILVVSPFVFAFPAGIATNESVVSGILIGIMSLVALMVHNRWKAWPNLVLFNLLSGAGVFISPMLFHYNTEDAATWIQIVGGIVVMIIATVQMWRIAGSIASAADISRRSTPALAGLLS
jgi:SPW repeat